MRDLRLKWPIECQRKKKSVGKKSLSTPIIGDVLKYQRQEKIKSENIARVDRHSRIHILWKIGF